MKTLQLNKLLWEAYFYGVDYGQLTMEDERESEETFEAFNGVIFDKKYAMPMASTQKRQVHSEKWFKAKRKSKDKFYKMLKQIK